MASWMEQVTVIIHIFRIVSLSYLLNAQNNLHTHSDSFQYLKWGKDGNVRSFGALLKLQKPKPN